VDSRRDATVRVTGLGETLDGTPRSRPASVPTHIQSKETLRVDRPAEGMNHVKWWPISLARPG
jgi:hypothetical protein